MFLALLLTVHGKGTYVAASNSEIQEEEQRKEVELDIEMAVKKACFVLDAIRGKDLQTALGIVTYNPRYASSLIKKLLESAIANAENNNNMDPAKLYVEECFANKGPTMKRVKPRAQGRAYRIEKRMSHITVVLNER